MNAMPAMQIVDGKLLTQANQLCREIHPALFLSIPHWPKPVQDERSFELRFWVAITDIYNLFFDCMPYLFREHNQCDNVRYNSQADSLLKVLYDQSLITAAPMQDILQYTQAIATLRHCFCHNMLLQAQDVDVITNGIGFDTAFWKNSHYHHYTHNIIDTRFSYTKALGLVLSKTQSIFSIIFDALQDLHGAKRATVSTCLAAWQRSIAAWYLQSVVLKKRALTVYCASNSSDHRKGYPVKQKNYKVVHIHGKKLLCGKPIDDVLAEMIVLIDQSPAVATPELIYAGLFDKYK